MPEEKSKTIEHYSKLAEIYNKAASDPEIMDAISRAKNKTGKKIRHHGKYTKKIKTIEERRYEKLCKKNSRRKK